MKKQLNSVTKLSGPVEVPGDKSVSHRAMIFGAMATGRTRVQNLLSSGDVHSTQDCLRAMGIDITGNAKETFVIGRGKHGFKDPHKILNCGNSGTTIRLLMGLLAGQNFSTTLTGDESLVKRPMKRVAAPLTEMGGRFILTNDNYAPLTVKGSPLKGVRYSLKVASAQVKTSLLLAALYANGKTQLTGEIGSRDHTERLLPHFGVRLEQSEKEISLHGTETLNSAEVSVPGDPSSAAFWMAAASMIKGGDIQIQNVSLNPTRTGFMKVLKKMGALIETEITQDIPEPMGNLRVRYAPLKGVHVTAEEIPSLIDEIPILAVLATQAEGETVIHGAQELRVKESDRIEAVALNLRAMGVEVTTFDDGLSIKGPQALHGAVIESFLDHRIAMSFSIAALIASSPTEINGVECVEISYPQFYDVLKSLT